MPNRFFTLTEQHSAHARDFHFNERRSLAKASPSYAFSVDVNFPVFRGIRYLYQTFCASSFSASFKMFTAAFSPRS